jgi:hypothetical protein
VDECTLRLRWGRSASRLCQCQLSSRLGLAQTAPQHLLGFCSQHGNTFLCISILLPDHPMPLTHHRDARLRYMYCVEERTGSGLCTEVQVLNGLQPRCFPSIYTPSKTSVVLFDQIGTLLRHGICTRHDVPTHMAWEHTRIDDP